MLSAAKHPKKLSQPRAALGFLMKSFGCVSTSRNAGILRSLRSLRMTPPTFIAQNTPDITPAGGSDVSA
jgi:hypothetical protein